VAFDAVQERGDLDPPAPPKRATVRWVEVHCYVREERVAEVGAAIRAVTPHDVRVEQRNVRLDEYAGGFVADSDIWTTVL
jgi:hypothetical protein